MGYLKADSYDVFVSYAHRDDRPWGEVMRFCAELADVLNRRMSEKEGRRLGGSQAVQIWTDKVMPQHGQLETRLGRPAADAGILLVFMSPSYRMSEVCQREGEWFSEAGNKDKDYAIFILEIDADGLAAGETLPDFLRADSGRQLVTRPLYGDGKRWSLTTASGETTSEMREAMERLAGDLCNALWHIKQKGEEQLKQKGEEQPAVSASSAELGPVYLAFSPGDLQEYQREDLRRYLGAQNVTVLPEMAAGGPEDWLDALRSDLPQCQRYVQLLGRSCGQGMVSHPAGLAGAQLDLAGSKPRSLWIDPGLDPAAMTNEGYHALLAEIEAGSSRAESMQAFGDEIIAALSSPAVPEPGEASEAMSYVYIDAEVRDLDLAKELAREITNVVADPPVQPLVPDKTWSRAEMEDTRKVAKAVILLWGQSPRDWFLRKFRTLENERRRNKRRGGLALYPPPPNKSPGFDPSQHMDVLDRSAANDDGTPRPDAGASTEKLKEFCSALLL